MRRSTFALVASLLIVSMGEGFAATVGFSFINIMAIQPGEGGGTGTVTGTITLNPVANGTTAATSVVVTSNSDGFGGVGPNYIPFAFGTNSFTFTNGALTSFEFQSINNATLCCSLWMIYDLATGRNDAALRLALDAASVPFGAHNLTVTPPPSGVPIPPAFALFASGLGALGLLGWRRKKKAAL